MHFIFLNRPKENRNLFQIPHSSSSEYSHKSPKSVAPKLPHALSVSCCDKVNLSCTCRVLRSHLQKRYSIVFFDATLQSAASLNQNLTYLLHVRASASQLSCRSLNQNLSSVLDVDSLPGGQRGEAAAGEVKEVTIYECTIF